MKKKRKIGEIKSEIYQNVTFIFKKLGNFLPTSISLNSCLFLYHPFFKSTYQHDSLEIIVLNGSI